MKVSAKSVWLVSFPIYQMGKCERREPHPEGRHGTDNWLQTQETDLARPHGSQKEPTLPTAWFQTYRFHMVKHFCCYCHPLCGASRQQPQQANTDVLELHSPLSILPSTTTPRPLGKWSSWVTAIAPWCLLASVFLPTNPLDKPLMRITFLRVYFHPIISQEDSSGTFQVPGRSGPSRPPLEQHLLW